MIIKNPVKKIVVFPFPGMIVASTLFIFLTSCKTMQPLVDKTDKFFQSKRYKEAIIERDELCGSNLQLRNDTMHLGQKLRETEDNYKSLSNASGLQLAVLNEDLKKKSNELEKKEKLLKEREQKLKEMQAVIDRQDSLVNRLNSIVKNALLGFNADELTVEMKNGKVYISMSDKLLFKSGSADVELKGKDALKKLAEVMNKNADVDILIEGHTDNVPIKTPLYKDNWDLSAARATSVVRLLTDEYQIDAKRLTASGKGEHFPVSTNATSEGKSKNRRTEIILSPKLDELFKILDTQRN